ncbi:MAG TPA: hypothetical protein VMD75_11335 [Candidatus Binataceae bacterium]|nr:hypothetical protein [Candidatus Binataceae bacterium]
MEETIDDIQFELEEARRSFHQNVAELNDKVETVTTQLQPEHLLQEHLPLAACIIGTVGFVMGSSGDRLPIIRTLILGGLLGAIFREVRYYRFHEP